MKVLIVTGIFPPDHGGPATYIPQISRELAKRHHVIGVVTLSDVTAADIDSKLPFPVIRIPRQQNRLVRGWRTATTIRRLARPADVVLVNGLALEAILACKVLLSRPVVFKVVGDLVWERLRNAGVEIDFEEFQRTSGSFRVRILKILQSWYTRRADAVITPSHFLGQIVAGWGVPERRIHIVSNAVGQDVSTASIPNSKSYDLVTVARLVPWKGVDELIEVVSDNGWTLVVIGDGPQRSDLERLAGTIASDQVRFLGRIPAERIPEEVARSRVFVLNSTYEGLPHVILEAKAVSVPVVARSVGGVPEAVENGVDGFLIPPGDRKVLVDRIRALLDDSDRRSRMGRAGRRSLERRFSLNRMVDDTESVLSGIAHHQVATR